MVTYLEGNDSHSGQLQSHPVLKSYKIDVSIWVSHPRLLSSLCRETVAPGSDSFDIFLSFTLKWKESQLVSIDYVEQVSIY